MTPSLFELVLSAVREAHPVQPTLTISSDSGKWVALVGNGYTSARRFVRTASASEPEHVTIRRVLRDVGEWLLDGFLLESSSNAAVALRIELASRE